MERGRSKNNLNIVLMMACMTFGTSPHAAAALSLVKEEGRLGRPCSFDREVHTLLHSSVIENQHERREGRKRREERGKERGV